MLHDTSLDKNFTKENMLKLLYEYIELRADKEGKDFLEMAVEIPLVYDYMLLCAAEELKVSFTIEEIEKSYEYNPFISDSDGKDELADISQTNEKVHSLMMHIHEKSIDYIKEKLVNMGLLTVDFSDDGKVQYQAVGWNKPANSDEVGQLLHDDTNHTEEEEVEEFQEDELEDLHSSYDEEDAQDGWSWDVPEEESDLY